MKAVPVTFSSMKVPGITSLYLITIKERFADKAIHNTPNNCVEFYTTGEPNRCCFSTLTHWNAAIRSSENNKTIKIDAAR